MIHYTVNSKIFVRIYFFNSVKRHICNLENSQFGHDLPTSINNRVICLPFREGFHFHKTSHLRSFVKIRLKQIFFNLQYRKILSFSLSWSRGLHLVKLFLMVGTHSGQPCLRETTKEDRILSKPKIISH